METAALRRLLTPARTATAWIVGGLAWAIAGLVRGGSEEPIWILADVFLLVAILGLWSHRFGHSRLGSVGFIAATLGRIVFIAAEILAAAQHEDDNALLPIAALLTVIGMLLVGIAVLRAHVDVGTARFAPLAMGLYPLIVMFPYVAAHDGHASNAAITWWAITMLGVAATASAPSRTAERPAPAPVRQSV